jgi:rhodanese-related sulfurtransferase
LVLNNDDRRWNVQRIWLKQLLICLALVIGASAVGLTVNAARPKSLPLVQNWSETLAARTQAGLPSGLAVVPLERMVELYNQPEVVVVDARPKLFWEFERIPGAISLPVEEVDPRAVKDFLAGLPQGAHIITYCDGVSCHAAEDLAKKIAQAGYEGVGVFSGGIQEWKANQMPVESEG